ncbi:TrmB family transcriptional regulator [Palaeococcus pacificus DY20341]|uniref:TrmB family transcriptional regulator n=1 Tax=Palaeococcus pacificus DY20341 TaxID=1343739 RepID=A0A075LT78_9EURY|nr:helix-turn-helix domain-containing protein [Palaeococcus pacificus]AIF69970.1 TrmB family transcriptional regulator [Palaeococcus pacificus DY20341]
MEDIFKSLNQILKNFELTNSEIRIYSLLLKESLTPRQISKKLGLSERIVREKLRHLLELGLVERELINRGWIGYLYKARPSREALNTLIKKMEELLENFEKEVEKVL